MNNVESTLVLLQQSAAEIARNEFESEVTGRYGRPCSDFCGIRLCTDEHIWRDLGLCTICGGNCADGACDGRGQHIDADLVDGPLFARAA